MALDKNELEARLKKLTHQQITWFAARAALRVQPILGRYNSLDFKQNQEARLTAVFRALNAALGLGFHRENWYDSYGNLVLVAGDVVAYAAAADAAAYADADAAAAAAAYAAAADAADATTAADAADDATAADGAYADAAAAAADAADATTAADAADDATAADGAYADAADDATAADGAYAAAARDLALLEKSGEALPVWADLWYGERPEEHTQWENDLLKGLEKIGLGYWARRYREWVDGTVHEPLALRALMLPEEFSDFRKTNIPALTAYLEEGEREFFAEREAEKKLEKELVPIERLVPDPESGKLTLARPKVNPEAVLAEGRKEGISVKLKELIALANDPNRNDFSALRDILPELERQSGKLDRGEEINPVLFYDELSEALLAFDDLLSSGEISDGSLARKKRRHLKTSQDDLEVIYPELLKVIESRRKANLVVPTEEQFEKIHEFFDQLAKAEPDKQILDTLAQAKVAELQREAESLGSSLGDLVPGDRIMNESDRKDQYRILSFIYDFKLWIQDKGKRLDDWLQEHGTLQNVANLLTIYQATWVILESAIKVLNFLFQSLF